MDSGKCHGTRGIGKVPVGLCTKMTKIAIFIRDRSKLRERFVKASLVQCTVYWWSQLEHQLICKSETVPINSCVNVYFQLDDNVETLLVEYTIAQQKKNRASHDAHLSHLISSVKQHNYTLHINYQNWTRNIKNNILLLQDIHRVSEKHSEKMMTTFLQGYRHFI